MHLPHVGEGKLLQKLQHEFMKPNATKDFAFLTFVYEEAWDVVLSHELSYHYEKICVNITRDKETTAPLELCISTTLVANNLPQK